MPLFSLLRVTVFTVSTVMNCGTILRLKQLGEGKSLKSLRFSLFVQVVCETKTAEQRPCLKQPSYSLQREDV